MYVIKERNGEIKQTIEKDTYESAVEQLEAIVRFERAIAPTIGYEIITDNEIYFHAGNETDYVKIYIKK